MGTEVDEKEVFFSLFQDLATKAINYQILQMLKKLARILLSSNKNLKSRLLDLKQNGKTRVK